MTDKPVLKYQPEDFLVRESMVVRLSDSRAAQHYLLLRKCGYTTMEAVRLIAAEIGLPVAELTYGGLKDEDGITEQLVSIPAGALSDRHLGPEGWVIADGAGRWLRLHHYGYGDEPLRVGKLDGNGFKIVVRNLPESQFERLSQLSRINLFFLNYYDTQRFGVPGGPKRTHEVGSAIIDQDWDRALRELAGLGAPESEMASRWQGSADEFFLSIDPRTVSFYLSALSSYHWNGVLREIVARNCDGDWFPILLDGHEYRYLRSSELVRRVLGHAPELPYQRYAFDGRAQPTHQSARPTVVQAAVTIDQTGPDDLIACRYQAGFSFFLPSGCYATAAVRQLLDQI